MEFNKNFNACMIFVTCCFSSFAFHCADVLHVYISSIFQDADYQSAVIKYKTDMVLFSCQVCKKHHNPSLLDI